MRMSQSLTSGIARPWLLISSLVLWAAITGCGFQLRGELATTLSDERVAVSAAPDLLVLKNQLENALIAAGAKLAPLTEARSHVTLVNSQQKRRTLMRDESGRASEVEIRWQVRFQVQTLDVAAGQLSDPDEQQISVRRSYLYDNARLLSVHQLEQNLMQQMRTELAHKIVRYMALRTKQEEFDGD